MDTQPLHLISITKPKTIDTTLSMRVQCIHLGLVPDTAVDSRKLPRVIHPLLITCRLLQRLRELGYHFPCKGFFKLFQCISVFTVKPRPRCSDLFS